MNALHQRDWIRDQLLRDRCGDTSKHQKGGLDRVMRFDDDCSFLVITIRTRPERKDGAMPVWTEAASIITLHKGIISLSFDILKSSKEKAIAKRILQQRDFPTGKYSAKADFGQLLDSIL